jgi:hypothetical protein
MRPETREHIAEAAYEFETSILSFIGEMITPCVLEEMRQITLTYLRRVQQVAPIDFDPALVGMIATFKPTEEIPAWINREFFKPNHIVPNAYTRGLFKDIETNLL